MKDDEVTQVILNDAAKPGSDRQPFCFGVRKSGTLILKVELEGEDEVAKQTISKVVEVINFIRAGQLIVRTEDEHMYWFNVEDWGSIEFIPKGPGAFGT